MSCFETRHFLNRSRKELMSVSLIFETSYNSDPASNKGRKENEYFHPMPDYQELYPIDREGSKADVVYIWNEEVH